MSTIEIVYEGDVGVWVVGRVAQRGSEVFVEYTDEHLASGADLAPLRHPLTERSRRFSGTNPDHLPGLLADAGPDSWGRSVLRRDMRLNGVERPGPLAMLAWLGRRTMGALTFRPVEGPEVPAATLVDLDRMQGEALRLLSGDGGHDLAAAQVARAAGASAGGARPKITAAFSVDGELVVDSGNLPAGAVPWLVKFHSPDDSAYLSAIEATYLQMARSAGITTCEHRLLDAPSGTRYLAVRRFDRRAVPNAQPHRIHMATAAGLLEAYPERGQHVSYDDIIRLTRYVTGDQQDTAELVRRAVFNVVAHNRDDHARNTSYLWTPGDGWHLAPAYDLTHSMGPRPVFAANRPGEHYLDVAGKGTDILRADLIGLHQPAGMAAAEVSDMIDAALDAVGTWSALASANGVRDDIIERTAQTLPALTS
ncbi:MAG: type II toxin-antitoxin system HipA family toxin [Microthrixaceae bacterium]|nr:type II toxin-antitoxin system HipA family toxin [Microthrixaceae bacterium]HMT23887.1 type II toxin-antitoxin system HipA family toxin [Microthrixaceae bacterium]HMT60232.1 type II toxin-antitoxin system HipA family toxin [Microthrixaceae bacterium]